MKTKNVTVARVYLTEGSHQLEPLFVLLHDVEKVRGVTAFRGISGFGESGRVHSSTLLDMSLDLPIVVEFFDEPEKMEQILEKINDMVKPGRILCWPAQKNTGDH